MSEQINILKDDIAFMRALAQEGRRVPLLGGACLLAAGLIFSAATLVSWAMAAKLVILPNFWLVGVWGVATVVFYGVFALLMVFWRRAAKPGARTTANRAFRGAWSAGGWAMTAISIGSILTAWRLHSWLVFAAFPTIILSVYGAAWMISAVLSDRWWVRWVAAGCFIAAVGMTLLPSVQAEYLAFAAALLLLMAAPGAALMREEPSDIV
ncbi:MAG TPA: hypothetical protein VGL73_14425 [Caulobacteraceae bacterium]|jgi:hypothetical protein